MFNRTKGLLSCLFSTLLLTSVANAFPSVFPTGVTKYVTNRAVPGVVIFTGADGIIYAIKPDGSVGRTWESPIASASYGFAKPLLNGNLLVRMVPPPGAPSALVELNPAGDIVWTYTRPGWTFHHDHERLPNGNTLILCYRNIIVPSISDRPLRDDCVMEVTPGGTVVWDWQTSDHFAEFEFSPEALANIFAFGGDWAHANALEVIPQSNPHTDPRFRSGNIIISYRHINAIVIVDRATGAIAHWFDNLTVGQHNSSMIPGYLPGGGNILVFDNGYSDPILNPGEAAANGGPARRYSRVLEFDPTDPDPPVWEYNAVVSGFPNWWFWAPFISGAQRLPNGNTFITEGPTGRLLEVTPVGEIVWEYVSPFFGLIRGTQSNQIFRAYKLPCNQTTCSALE